MATLSRDNIVELTEKMWPIIYNATMLEVDPYLLDLESRRLRYHSYDTSLWPIVRWRVDQLATQQVDIHERAIEAAGFEGSEDVLDIGGNDGHQIAAMRLAGHTGRLICADNNGLALKGGEMMFGEELGPGSFIWSDAEDIQLDDSSVDAAMALFVLYDVEDLDQALAEMKRVTKPGGKIVVATSGPDNKFRMHELEAAIVEHLGGILAPSLTASFTNHTAREKLPQFFTDVREIPHLSTIYIRDPNLSEDHQLRLDAYKEGLISYHGLHSRLNADTQELEPLGSGEWEAAFEAVAWPMMQERISGKFGAWVDLLDRSVFVAGNEKIHRERRSRRRAGQRLVSDVDGTLHPKYIIHPVYDAFEADGLIEPGDSERLKEIYANYQSGQLEFSDFVNSTLKLGALMLADRPMNVAFKIAREVITDKDFVWFGFVKPMLEDAKRANTQTAIITAAPQFIAQAVKAALGIDKAYSTRYGGNARTGLFTGRIKQPMTPGRKADITRNLRLGFKRTIGLGDSEGDVGMLSLVDLAVAVMPTPELDDYATELGWPIVRDPSKRLTVVGFKL